MQLWFAFAGDRDIAVQVLGYRLDRGCEPLAPSELARITPAMPATCCADFGRSRSAIRRNLGDRTYPALRPTSPPPATSARSTPSRRSRSTCQRSSRTVISNDAPSS